MFLAPIALATALAMGLPPTMAQRAGSRIAVPGLLTGGYGAAAPRRLLGYGGGRGKGGKHRPGRRGTRKVAWDKRDAAKRRNVLRAKGQR